MSYEFRRGLGSLGEALGALQFTGRVDTRGHKDYPPDQGNTSFNFRDCRLKSEGEGSYGSVWDCNKIDHKTVTVRAGQNPPLPEGTDPERNCKVQSTTPAGTRYFLCPRWVVDAAMTESDIEGYKPRCLIEGQQGTLEWRLRAEKRPDAGSYADKFLHYTDVVRGDQVLRCKFAQPLPSKEAAFKRAAYDLAISQGRRVVTAAEQEQYGHLCEPYVTASGAEIPRKLSWRKETDYIGTTLVRTDVKDGDNILVCVPDTSSVKIQIDAELSRLAQERAWAAASQTSAAEQRRLEEQQAELQRILAEGEEPSTPFWVRYKYPLLMVGGMLVLGVGAALLQRVASKRKAMKSNPGVFAEYDGDGMWLFYWQQPGTRRRDATVIGWALVGSDSRSGDHWLVTEAVDGSKQVFDSFDDASQWLVKKTWRVVPGGF